jgi:hypothetical protein
MNETKKIRVTGNPTNGLTRENEKVFVSIEEEKDAGTRLEAQTA